jgi:protease I
MAAASGKKVLMVVASEGFRDPEYYEPKKVLEANGIKVLTTSITKTSIGAEGGIVNTDLLLKDAKANDYDAVVFIGGPGSYVLHDNPKAQQLAKDTVSTGKTLGAICAAVAIAAKAGVLQGIKATSFSGVADMVKACGAIYTGEGVTVDGKFVTADGAKSAKAFGEALAKALK